MGHRGSTDEASLINSFRIGVGAETLLTEVSQVGESWNEFSKIRGNLPGRQRKRAKNM